MNIGKLPVFEYRTIIYSIFWSGWFSSCLWLPEAFNEKRTLQVTWTQPLGGPPSEGQECSGGAALMFLEAKKRRTKKRCAWQVKSAVPKEGNLVKLERVLMLFLLSEVAVCEINDGIPWNPGIATAVWLGKKMPIRRGEVYGDASFGEVSHGELEAETPGVVELTQLEFLGVSPKFRPFDFFWIVDFLTQIMWSPYLLCLQL